MAEGSRVLSAWRLVSFVLAAVDWMTKPVTYLAVERKMLMLRHVEGRVAELASVLA